MTEAIVDELEFVDIDHEQREEMLRAQRAIRLGLEPLVEVTPVEEPGERVGVREPQQRLALLLLHEARADMACDDLERHEVGIFEGAPIEAIGDVEDATRVVVDHDRNRDERIRAVLAAADRKGSLTAADE